jgi:hypothetical protein
MSRRGSSKRLVLVGAVLILLAAAAWAARGRLGATPAPLGARAEQTRSATPKRLPAITAAHARAVQSITRADSSPAPTVMADTTRHARQSDDAGLHLKSVTAVGNPSDIDVVTSNVEQSTKSKVESAQRPESKPLFKKP